MATVLGCSGNNLPSLLANPIIATIFLLTDTLNHISGTVISP